ncbi:hypothetical protein RJ640_026360 [Escallonia rubra]|uniref:Small ribosomal subunit protein mS33 n=1 Tax=Escallonia rubra TaxID=112253 RepID=A0AA88QZS8_9ASTE|nr:hypothetical protein RJ640_026360 [Escallonia rubra]
MRLHYADLTKASSLSRWPDDLPSDEIYKPNHCRQCPNVMPSDVVTSNCCLGRKLAMLLRDASAMGYPSSRCFSDGISFFVRSGISFFAMLQRWELAMLRQIWDLLLRNASADLGSPSSQCFGRSGISFFAMLWRCLVSWAFLGANEAAHQLFDNFLPAVLQACAFCSSYGMIYRNGMMSVGGLKNAVVQAATRGVTEARERIFGHRSPHKILRKKLIGEKVARSGTLTISRKMTLLRLSKLEMLKRRGKGPPKKGHGKCASKRKQGATSLNNGDDSH